MNMNPLYLVVIACVVVALVAWVDFPLLVGVVAGIAVAAAAVYVVIGTPR